MMNENVLTPDDSRFELPDVDSLLEDAQSSEPVSEPVAPVRTLRTNVSDVDPYNTVMDPDPDDDNDVNDDDNEPVIDALHQYLMNRGIKDTRKLQYENEDGETTEVDFDSLPVEEQLSIIEELSRPNMTDAEIQTIDYLRRNNMTLAQVVDYFANQKLQSYIEENGQPQKTYTIDDYSDDELYLADLQNKYPNFTEEKLLAKLEAAQSNPDLFKEEVTELREFYKSQEQAMIENQAKQDAYAQQQYTNALYEAVNNFNEIALDYTDDKSDTLEIEVDDKRKSMAYLLDVDAEGKTQLVRDMENPDALIELAWLRTCGADALANQSKYYKEVISERNKEIARLRKQIEREKTSNSVVVPTETKRASKNSSSPWDMSGLLEN